MEAARCKRFIAYATLPSAAILIGIGPLWLLCRKGEPGQLADLDSILLFCAGLPTFFHAFHIIYDEDEKKGGDDGGGGGGGGGE